MKSERPSRTALFVAFGRALADVGASHVPDFHDPTARVFLSDKGKKRLAKVEQQLREGGKGFMLGAARVSADLMALRTSAIDAAVRDAVARGATQLVILGAGYDGRAWRMKELAGVRVFEVDHPATQNAKRSHLNELPPPIGNVSFVPVDFERESLDAALDAAGHDRTRPTCWIWEGVVMYLTRDAMRAHPRQHRRPQRPGVDRDRELPHHPTTVAGEYDFPAHRRADDQQVVARGDGSRPARRRLRSP